MSQVVTCSRGRACHGDHHGWDCPLSDPQGDVLRTLMDPMANPILEAARRELLSTFGAH
jgi:hypothetical protein